MPECYFEVDVVDRAQLAEHLSDPLRFFKLMWPHYTFYREQREVVLSVRDAVETYVPAGNKLGKDYVAGAISVAFFLNPAMFFDKQYVKSVEQSRTPTNPFPHTRRVMTTSVKDEHLDLLWSEIGRFLSSASSALGQLTGKGGQLIVNDKEVRFAHEKDATSGNVVNFLKGQVSKGEEGMSGLHAAYTLLVCDEASGVSDMTYGAGQGWAKRFLFIGNPWPCENFFRKAVDGGDVLAA